jgi:hypothetical protein
MILSTHAVVGGALASLFPSHPVAAFAVGFASHFVIDAIPHWDYPLRSISVARGARNQVRLTPALARDVALIGFDAIAGLALAIGIFATPSTIVAVLAGAVGAMLPDPLQCTRFILMSLWPRSSASIDGCTQSFDCIGQLALAHKWPL